MAHVEGEIIIHRPVEEVFDFVADERHEPLYNPEMLQCDLLSGEPVGRGSRFRAVMSMRGKPVEMTIEFTNFDCPRLLASVSKVSTMEIAGTLLFDPVSEGTRLRWSWTLKPHGLLVLMTPMVTHIGRRQELRIWTSLKRYLEEQPVKDRSDDGGTVCTTESASMSKLRTASMA